MYVCVCVCVQEVDDLRQTIQGQAATLEAGLLGAQAAASREVLVLRHALEAELAKKLDVKTFLASTSSTAAQTAAGILGTRGAPSPRADGIGGGSSAAAAAIARLGAKLKQTSIRATAEGTQQGI